MMDWWAVFAGACAAGVWLVYLLLTAGRTVRTGCWPFFVPRACVLAWETSRGSGAGWAGAFIVLLFAALVSLGTLTVGGTALLATQALLDMIASR